MCVVVSGRNAPRRTSESWQELYSPFGRGALGPGGVFAGLGFARLSIFAACFFSTRLFDDFLPGATLCVLVVQATDDELVGVVGGWSARGGVTLCFNVWAGSAMT